MPQGDGEEEDRGSSATPHYRALELKHGISLTKTTYRYSGTPDDEGGGLLLYAPPGMPPVNGKKYFNVLKFYSLSSQVPPPPSCLFRYIERHALALFAGAARLHPAYLGT